MTMTMILLFFGRLVRFFFGGFGRWSRGFAGPGCPPRPPASRRLAFPIHRRPGGGEGGVAKWRYAKFLPRPRSCEMNPLPRPPRLLVAWLCRDLLRDGPEVVGSGGAWRPGTGVTRQGLSLGYCWTLNFQRDGQGGEALGGAQSTAGPILLPQRPQGISSVPATQSQGSRGLQLSPPLASAPSDSPQGRGNQTGVSLVLSPARRPGLWGWTPSKARGRAALPRACCIWVPSSSSPCPCSVSRCPPSQLSPLPLLPPGCSIGPSPREGLAGQSGLSLR